MTLGRLAQGAGREDVRPLQANSAGGKVRGRRSIVQGGPGAVWCGRDAERLRLRRPNQALTENRSTTNILFVYAKGVFE